VFWNQVACGGEFETSPKQYWIAVEGSKEQILWASDLVEAEKF